MVGYGDKTEPTNASKGMKNIMYIIFLVTMVLSGAVFLIRE